MIKTVILAILLLFCANCLAQAPDIVFDTTEFNFGKINEGEKVSHEFQIKNKGQVDLLIERIIPDCGCIIVVNPISQPIKPEDSAILKIDFNSRGFSGNQLRSLVIYSNDPDQRAATIYLSGEVVPEIKTEPRLLIFNPVLENTKNVSISLAESSTAELVSVSENSKYIEIKNQNIKAKAASFDVILTDTIPLGEFRERVTVKLKNSANQFFNIPVLISRQALITVLPQNLSLGIIGSQSEYSINLTSSVGKAFKILEIESKHPAIEVQNASEAAVSHILKVTVDPALVSRDIRSLIRVKTDQTDEPEITISIYGIKSDLKK